MTVYTIVIEGREPLEQIATVDREATFRPRVGDILKIERRPETEWKVTRSIPSTNPDNIAVTYVVEDLRMINIIRGGGVAEFDQAFVRNAKFGNSATRFKRSLF